MDLLGQLAHIGIHLLEFFFFTGIFGSLSVVLISVIGDIRDIPQKDEPA